jgi:isocitrate dehydrogenase kinase/phosphatase
MLNGRPVTLAHDIVATVLDGFDTHDRIFLATRPQARDRFEMADWAAVREAEVARAAEPVAANAPRRLQNGVCQAQTFRA